MELLYNVHYEIASILFLTVMLAYIRIQYSAKDRSNKKFRQLVFMVIVANILDVGTAYMISYAAHLPWLFCQLLNTVFYLLLLYMLFAYIEYIEIFLKHQINSVNRTINKLLLLIYVLVLFLNIFTGWAFNFNEKGEYVHGPLYLYIFILSGYFIIDSIFIAIINKKKMSNRQIFSIMFFCTMEILGTILQLTIFKDTLLTMFFASVALVVIMFAMETPDYFRLMVALDELKKTAEELDIARKDAEDSKIEAEEANKAKSAFLASMSHEIRTPINGVLGMNSIIMKETTDPKILEYATNIDSAGNGLLSLINDILDFSKIESGKMEIVNVEYKLSKVLSDAYNMVFMRAQSKQLELLFENNLTIPNDLYGDETRVRQIIVNLLTNGIKYTETGMVLLTADWEEGAVADEMTLIISVKDTGIGIKKSNLNKLFTAFSRVDQVRNRNIEGTGLGLRITKQFIDMMGGSITVDSEYGQGSEFVVKIPQRVVSKQTIGEYANYSNISTNNVKIIKNQFKCPKGHILVVDDVELNLKVIKGLLKNTLLNIDTALSGNECLNKIQKNTYDVIFLDHLMPNMDGIETLHEMKKLTTVFNPKTPVIMLTANAITGVKEEYIKEGFTDYLSKPVMESELNEVLIKYLPSELLESFDDDDKLVDTLNEKANPSDIYIEEPELSAFEKRFEFLDTKMGMVYCMENEEFYESIIREFKNSSKYEEIQDCYDAANLEEYAVLVHGVKSAAMTIGAAAVSDMAKGLEFAANDNDVDYLKDNHYKFMRKYGELLDNLDMVYGGY